MLLTLLALHLRSAHAGDVLVPEATPAQLSDFSVAYLFYDMVLTQLRDRGLNVQDADRMRPWAASDADACYDNPDCPRLIWDHEEGGTVLVVLGVGQTDDGLSVTARIYKEGEDEPAEEIIETVAGGAEEKLAAKIAGIAAGLNGDSEPARIAPKTTSEPKATSKEPEEEPDEREEKEEKKPKAPAAPEDTADDEQAHMGVPGWAYTKFRESGLSRREWLNQQRVRTGKVSIELLGGYGLGDVNRGYGVRVAIQDGTDGFETFAASTVEGPGPGAGFAGAAAITYTPAWFLETSLQLGLVLGTKALNAGWECPSTDCAETSDVQDYEPVNSVQGFIEPRARVLPIATGYVKPYVLAGLHLRLWDGFEVPDGSSVDYPNSPGGAGVGLVLGGGVSLDVVPNLSFLIEVPYSITLADGGKEVNSADVEAEPTALDETDGLLRITGGIAVRF